MKGGLDILYLLYNPLQLGGSLYSRVLMNQLVMLPRAGLLPFIKQDAAGGCPE